MDGEGMCKYTVIMQTSPAARNKDLNILKKELSNKAWLIYKDGHLIWTGQEWKKSKGQMTRLFWNKLNVSDFSTLFLLRLVMRLKHGSSYRK